MKIVGIAATLVILLIVPAYMFVEPTHQENLLEEYQTHAVLTSTDLYAENCAICHGASGEGIGDTPPLNTDAVRNMSESDLYKVIARGRTSTLMAAWATEEGGILSDSQVEDMIIFIQEGNWEYVNARVEELGLHPPEPIKMEVSEEMIASVAALENGDALVQGLETYAANCAACHGANGAGTVIAPALDTVSLREAPREEILTIVNSTLAAKKIE